MSRSEPVLPVDEAGNFNSHLRGERCAPMEDWRVSRRTAVLETRTLGAAAMTERLSSSGSSPATGEVGSEVRA